jgi:hypothetical protein
LALFLQLPWFRKTIIEKLDPAILPDEVTRLLYKTAVSSYTSLEPTAQQTFYRQLREHFLSQHVQDLVALLDQCGLLGEQLASTPDTQVPHLLDASLFVLTAAAKEKRRKALEAEIRLAESAGDRERVAQLIQEFTHLT